jgi:hypothetical protein
MLFEISGPGKLVSTDRHGSTSNDGQQMGYVSPNHTTLQQSLKMTLGQRSYDKQRYEPMGTLLMTGTWRFDRTPKTTSTPCSEDF